MHWEPSISVLSILTSAAILNAFPQAVIVILSCPGHVFHSQLNCARVLYQQYHLTSCKPDERRMLVESNYSAQGSGAAGCIQTQKKYLSLFSRINERSYCNYCTFGTHGIIWLAISAQYRFSNFLYLIGCKCKINRKFILIFSNRYVYINIRYTLYNLYGAISFPSKYM